MISTKSQIQITAIDSFVDTKVIAERLLNLSLQTGCDVIQKNGQRYYGPPQDWHLPLPIKGSEIFIGRLPRDCFEDELVPIFETIGQIYQIRMMMNFSGFNRGFAFITFANPETAWKAVNQMNDYEIRPGHKIGVSKSIDNCRLYIGGIPIEMTKNEALDELRNLVTQPIKNIILYPSVQDVNKNRGFLFAEFENHREAAMAKRLLIPGTVKFWDNDVVVDWADPEPDIDPAIMSGINKLFIRYMNPIVTADYFRKLLLSILQPEHIERIYCTKHYAFLHFDSRENAENAKDFLNQAVLNGDLLDIQWARPKCFKKHSIINTNCRSLPPRLRQSLHANKTNHNHGLLPIPTVIKSIENMNHNNLNEMPPHPINNPNMMPQNALVSYNHIQNLNINKIPPTEPIPQAQMPYQLHPIYYSQPPPHPNTVFGTFY